MSGKTSASSRERFIFAMLSDGSKGRPLSRPPHDQGDFLRISTPEHDVVPRRMHLCLEVHPQSLVVSVGGRSTVCLRNVRYNVSSVGSILWLRCVECGFVSLVPQVQVGGARYSVCPACKSAPSDQSCATWHTYGRCDECTGEVLEPCPFELDEPHA